MNLESKSDSILRLVSHNPHSLLTNFVLISFSRKKFARFTDLFLITLEYIQIISQGLILYSKSSDGFEMEFNTFFKGVIYVAKLFNPAYLISFDNSNEITRTTLCIVLLFVILKYLLAFYILFVTICKFKGIHKLNSLWRLTLKIQGRILYYFVTSFWANMITSTIQEGFEFFGLSQVAILIVCFLLIGIEFIFTFSIQILCCYFLPQKSLLARKDNHVEIITFLQKASIQILQVALPYNDARGWVLTVMSLLFNLTRGRHFFTTLPLYDLQALFYQGFLVMIVFSLSISSFLNEIVKLISAEQGGGEFVIMTWIIIGVLSSKISNNLLNNKAFDLITKMQNADPKLLIHKICLTRQLRKLSMLPSKFNERSQWSYMFSTIINAKIESIFVVSDQNISLDLYSKESSNQIFLSYLERLIAKFPKNNFVKLYAAYFYAKKMKFYGKAIHLISELERVGGFAMVLNTSLLLNEIEETIKSDYKKEAYFIDLFTYVKSKVYTVGIKKQILIQADLQTKLCQESITDSPDLSKILDYAVTISKNKNKIGHKVKKLARIAPDYYIQPLLFYANYQLVLNHSLTDATYFMKAYLQRQVQYNKYFQGTHLVQENFYQETNALFIISGQKADAGKIVFCNQQVANLLGGEINSYLGTNISSIFLPKLEGFNDTFLKATIEIGNTKTCSMNHLSSRFVCHKNGHMIKVDYYINIYPILAQGFYLCIVMRPVPNTTNFILIHQNGDIEGATQKIGNRLGLNSPHNSTKKSFNIEEISHDLARVNTAFNIVCKNSKMSLEGLDKNKLVSHSQIDSTLFAKTNEVSREILNFTKEWKEWDSKTSRLTLFTNHQLKMSAEEAAEIYEIFQNEGKSIELIPIKGDRTGRKNLTTQIRFHYHCQITTIPFESETMRLLALTELKKSPIQEEFIEDTTKSPYKRKMIFEDINLRRIETQVSEQYFSEVFKTENEKQEGWIDFKTLQLTTERKNLVSNQEDFKLPRIKLAENSFILCETENVIQLTPPPPKVLASSKKPYSKQWEISDSINQSFNENVKVQIEANDIFGQEGRGSVAASNLSRTSYQIRKSKAFETALTAKYYSKSSIIFTGIFYLLIACMVAVQIYLTTTMNQTGHTIKIKSDILVHAQLRTYHLANLQSLLRQILDLESGRLSQENFGFIARPLDEFINISMDTLDTLLRTNREIFLNAHLLEKEIRGAIFSQNIRIFDSILLNNESEYIYMTSFQGTQRIADVALQQISLLSVNSFQENQHFNFILRNSLNDLYVENDYISDIFLQSVKNQINFVLKIVVVYLAASTTFISAITILICFFVWKKYLQTKKFLLAFVKLNETKMKDFLNKLNQFKQAFEFERSFDVQKKEEEENDLMKVKKLNFSNFEKLKTPKHQGIQKFYLLLVLKWIILALGMIILVISLSVLALTSMNFLQSKVLELDFTHRLKTKINIAVITMTELVIPNGSQLIQNTPTEIAILDSIDEIVSLRTEVNKILAKEKLLRNEVIKNHLFKNECYSLSNSLHLFCSALEREALSSGFIPLLSTLENLLKQKHQRYLESDKSTLSLKDIELDQYDTLTSVKRILLEGSSKIAEEIEHEYLQFLQSSKRKRSSIFGIAIGYFGFLCILTWIMILSKLRKTNNLLKKVLQTLPTELLLSNFILKKFLIKTSEGALDSIKNSI